MICENCEKAGRKSVEAFTTTERTFMLASAVAMLRSIHANPKASNDLIVANSVVTKLLLSFVPESRADLVRHFRVSIGMEIKLDKCPHGVLVTL